MDRPFEYQTIWNPNFKKFGIQKFGIQKFGIQMVGIQIPIVIHTLTFSGNCLC